jgi:AraC-like DNA-binding protein
VKRYTHFSMVNDRTRLLPVFLKGLGVNFEQYETIRPDGFDYYHLMTVRSGQGVIKTADHVYSVNPNDIILLFAGRPHHYYPRSESWRINWITFGGQGVPGLLRYLELDREGLYPVPSGASIDREYKRVADLLERGGSTEALDLSRKVIDLLELTSRGERGSTELPAGVYRSPVEPVIDYMAAHYSNDIGLDNFCALLNVTPQHLCLLFKKHTGHSPMEYLGSFRLSKAKAMLIEHPERQIKEIAYSCGFTDSRYFHRVFKKETKKTPGQFRLNPS